MPPFLSWRPLDGTETCPARYHTIAELRSRVRAWIIDECCRNIERPQLGSDPCCAGRQNGSCDKAVPVVSAQLAVLMISAVILHRVVQTACKQAAPWTNASPRGCRVQQGHKVRHISALKPGWRNAGRAASQAAGRKCAARGSFISNWESQPLVPKVPHCCPPRAC